MIDVTLELVGFGTDRPTAFGASDRIAITLPDGASVADALAAVGLTDMTGLAVLRNDSPVRTAAQPDVPVETGDTLNILSAVEGGKGVYVSCS